MSLYDYRCFLNGVNRSRGAERDVKPPSAEELDNDQKVFEAAFAERQAKKAAESAPPK